MIRLFVVAFCASFALVWLTAETRNPKWTVVISEEGLMFFEYTIPPSPDDFCTDGVCTV
jgi:hypothetical protein